MAEPVYVLSSDCQLHSSDVKHVSWFSNTELYSASRDHTARAMSTDAAHSGALIPSWTFTGHQAFVNFVMVHPSLPLLDGEMGIITGSNDRHIVVWSSYHGGIEAVLDAHSEGVRCGLLLPHTADFVSGGWDKVCVVWDAVSAKPKQVFTGHQSSVLCLAHLGGAASHTIVSGSGDKSVIAWNVDSAKTIHVFSGHTDSVQAVVAISEDLFASAGNDGMVMVWSLAARSVMNVFAGHEHLIFALAFHAPTQVLFTASEDRSVKVWRDVCDPSISERGPQQVILHPCVVWTVAVASESGDIATGGSDGFVRVWTLDDSRLAPIEKLEALEAAVNNQQIDIKEASAAAAAAIPDVGSLPSVDEAQQIKGTREGDKKFFRNGSVVEVHVWNQGAWVKIGVVVAGPDHTPYTGAPIPKEKKFYNGKHYDYLFDVEIENHPLKLPYNRGQNIFDAAQSFINDNAHLGVSQESKESIVQHILTLIDPQDAALIGAGAPSGRGASAGVGADGAPAFSEFAREAAELRSRGQQQAQSWGEAKQRIEASGEDVAFSTFAQEGREQQRQQQMASAPAAVSRASCTTAVGSEPKTFAVFNVSGAKAKVLELVGSPEYDGLLDQCALMSTLSSSGHSSQDVGTLVDGTVGLYAALPATSRFPAIDLMRVLALNKAASLVMMDTAITTVAELLSETQTDIDRLVALRLVANVLSHCAGDPPTSAASGRAFMDGVFRPLIAVVRSVFKGKTPNGTAAVIAVLHNATCALRHMLEQVASPPADERLHETVKAFTAVIAESILFLNNEDPTVLSLLNCALTMQQTAGPEGTRVAAMNNQFLGPTLRLIKTGSTSNTALLRVVQQLLSTPPPS